MIDINDLTHTVQYSRETDTANVDDYGQPVVTSTSKNERCFYDFPKEEMIITRDEKKIKVEAILFMHPSSAIGVDDTVTSVKDSAGSAITTRAMKVSDIRKANDPDGVHHLEVMLSVE